ncbi:MAG TPA: hypothetical protein VMU00_12890, partial [Steroidobacteraceae bacterium]|nr:hypothetical protein [Steroidobacteraceae bacterium]
PPPRPAPAPPPPPRVAPPPPAPPPPTARGTTAPATPTRSTATSTPAAKAPAAARPAAGPARGGSKRESRGATGKQARLPADGSQEAEIVADAVRLLKWGRQWHELPEAIARIAGRPGVVEVRKCLRSFKAEIEKAAAE